MLSSILTAHLGLFLLDIESQGLVNITCHKTAPELVMHHDYHQGYGATRAVSSRLVRMCQVTSDTNNQQCRLNGEKGCFCCSKV